MTPAPRPTDARYSGAPSSPTHSPTEAAKYDGDHNTVAWFRRCGNSWRSTRAVRPVERAHHRCRRIGRPDPHEQVHMIGHHFVRHDLRAMLSRRSVSSSSSRQRATRPPATPDADTSNTTPDADPASTRLPACGGTARPGIPRTLRDDTDKTRHRPRCPPARPDSPDS